MIYELVSGETDIINAMLNDGWVLHSTFPNPYPQPYFFALMQLEHENEREYDVIALGDNLKRNGKLDVWQKTNNAAYREARNKDYPF